MSKRIDGRDVFNAARRTEERGRIDMPTPRKVLAAERKRESEKLTRKEASMKKAKSALADTYAKYGIIPLADRPKPETRPVVIMPAKRKQMTPAEHNAFRGWLNSQSKESQRRTD